MNHPRAFIIHGWAGRHDQDWLPWAVNQLTNQGYDTIAPAMPSPDYPVMTEWLARMSEVIGELRSTDVLIGHSMGCQTILRYLDQKNQPVDKVILIAAWVTLSPEALPLAEDLEIVKPWYEVPIDYPKIKELAHQYVAIFSDDDPWVPAQENSQFFADQLGAEIVMQHHCGHFMQEYGGITELPILLKYL